MNIILYITSLIGFMRFFYAIGVRYIGIIPFMIVGIIVFISSKDPSSTIVTERERQQYVIYAAWIAMLIGMIGIGQFIGDSAIHTGLRILTINIIFGLGSYIFSYQDGTIMAKIGYVCSIVYIIRQSSYVGTWADLSTIIQLLWVLSLGLVGFVVGVIGHWRHIESQMYYLLFVLSGGGLMIVIGQYIQDVYSILFVDSVLVLTLAIAMYYILSYDIPTETTTKTISLRRILAGEKIIKNTRIPHKNTLRIKLYTFVSQMPLWTRYMIEGLNCGLVIFTIILYLSSITAHSSQRHQFIYWVIIGLFIACALVLKRIGFTSVMQKITLFAVINYAIYLTLYTIFDGSILAIVGRAIVWNIMSSIFIFYGPSSFVADILSKKDYLYWIVMTVIALCINIYLLRLTTLPGQLIFSFVFLYCGLQGILLYYGIKHVQQLE